MRLLSRLDCSVIHPIKDKARDVVSLSTIIRSLDRAKKFPGCHLVIGVNFLDEKQINVAANIMR